MLKLFCYFYVREKSKLEIEIQSMCDELTVTHCRFQLRNITSEHFEFNYHGKEKIS